MGGDVNKNTLVTRILLSMYLATILAEVVRTIAFAPPSGVDSISTSLAVFLFLSIIHVTLIVAVSVAVWRVSSWAPAATLSLAISSGINDYLYSFGIQSGGFLVLVEFRFLVLGCLLYAVTISRFGGEQST